MSTHPDTHPGLMQGGECFGMEAHFSAAPVTRPAAFSNIAGQIEEGDARVVGIAAGRPGKY
jgi:hypothetical protein